MTTEGASATSPYRRALRYIQANPRYWMFMREQGWTLDRLAAHFAESAPASVLTGGPPAETIKPPTRKGEEQR